jgi:hypothetical protein
MTPVVGVVVIAALLAAWFMGRRAANKIKKRRQLRPKRRAPVRVVKHNSKRSEMRAGEDPTTVAGEMNTTTRPGADQPERK